MPFECPSCKNEYIDILDHIRKKHPTNLYTKLQLQPIGLIPCPTCATACKGAHGVKTHSAKIHGIIGNSKPTAKRPAKSPSPGVERPTTRQKRDLIAPKQLITKDSSSDEDLYSASTAPSSPTPSFEDAISTPAPTTPAASTAPKRPRTSTLKRSTVPLTPSLPCGLQQSIHRPQAPPASTPLRPQAPPAPTPLRPQAPSAFTPLNQDAIDHSNAIRSSLEKPAVQTLLAYSAVHVPEKRLHARQAVLFTEAANRAALAFLRQPREKQLLDFLLLPRVLGIGLHKEEVAKTLKAYPTTLPEVPEASPEPPGTPSNDPPAKRAVKLLEKGYIGRASRALIDPTPLAPDTPDTLNTLYSKHPIGHENPFGNANPSPGQNIAPETVRQAIRSINREKAPGLSGWTRPLLDIALNSTNSPVNTALTHLANMIRQGTAPGVDLLCASRLIGLQKPDGGVRPIAIGDLIYKVALKAILITSFRASMLLPNQLGVSTPGGVEPIIFLLDEAISGPNTLKTQQIASLDLTNAYNRIGRTSIASAVAKYAPTLYRAAKWAYNQPSILVTNSGQTLASAEALLPVVVEAFKDSPIALNRQKSTESPISQLQTTGLKALG
ncbi:hypothetical protein DL98DRAFT_642167, partial [Cadophora sp. DSE1049]